MTILITGGAGFIGQYVARRLANSGGVVALDCMSGQVHRDPESSRSRFPGRVVSGDVLDADAWAEAGRCDAIVHLAAETGTAQSMYESERYRRVNVEGTRRAVEMAESWGVPLVALSSRAVYGEGRYRMPDGSVVVGRRASTEGGTPEASQESDALAPVSVYGETKAEGETMLTSLAASVPVTVIRPQNVVGHGQALHNPYTGVLAAFLARLREGKPVQIYGDGHETRDFVHVSDVAALIEWSLGRTGTGEPLILNCGSGVRTTLVELAQYAIEGAPTGGTVEHVEVRRAGDIEHACADLARVREVGAPSPEMSPRDAVIDFIAKSWAEPGAESGTWDRALSELKQRGLAE